MGDTIRDVLKDKIPTDTACQVDVWKMIDLNIEFFRERRQLLDLGAGAGEAYDRLIGRIPELKYTGLDIEDSPEVNSRSRNDLDFHSYDGRRIPFEDSSFDIVFSRQVLEHVRYPDEVISEVSRIMRTGGIFVGSVSQLEPYHSHSIFNWTSYGIVQVFESHGLTVKQMRPGIDGVSLIFRRILNRDRFNPFFKMESIFNHFIDGQIRPNNIWERNFHKLMISGHIVWVAEKNS